MDHRKRNAGSDQTHSSLQEALLVGPINQMDAREGPETKFIFSVGLCHSDHEQQELKKRSDGRIGHNINNINKDIIY